jgi:hypothetical protein
MRAIPPGGPLHRDDRDPAPDWLDEPSREPADEQTSNRRRDALPTIVLLVSVVVLVLLVVLL